MHAPAFRRLAVVKDVDVEPCGQSAAADVIRLERDAAGFVIPRPRHRVTLRHGALVRKAKPLHDLKRGAFGAEPLGGTGELRHGEGGEDRNDERHERHLDQRKSETS